MSYGFDLMRLPDGVDPNEAYDARDRDQEKADKTSADGVGDINPVKEHAKQHLAQKLMARYPWLRMFITDYAEIARHLSISESEARRRFRKIELNGDQHDIQILLFDDTAAVNFSPGSNREKCREDVAVLWDCLRTLASQGGFSAYDPQVGKVLNLDSDFEEVRQCTCGEN